MTSSLAKAKQWPYPRHRHFQAEMRKAAGEWFAERDLAVSSRYRYILADRADWSQNIIVPRVAKYIQQVKSESEDKKIAFALHKYVHHGLSSQALLFNLIGPLIVDDDSDLLQQIFAPALTGVEHTHVYGKFEYENRKVFREEFGQPTSLDLVLADQDKNLLAFVECKFTESEFGGCSVFAKGDCDGRNPSADLNLCYLHYIGRRYWTFMKEHGFLEGPVGQEQTCIFGHHYQFFRVLLFAMYHHRPFALLYDERSPVFSYMGPQGERGLLPVLLPLVPDKLRENVIPISIQQALEAIKASGRHSWTIEFEQKYGL